MTLLALVSSLVSCDSAEPVAPYDGPITDPTQLYMRLTLNHRAINLSTHVPYNTVQLTAVPRDALGEPILGLPTPKYTSLDTARVKVTADGLVTAVATTNGVRVAAELTVGPVTQYDTAIVVVKDLTDPPMLDSLSMDRSPPDSAIRAILPSFHASSQGPSGSSIFPGRFLLDEAGISPAGSSLFLARALSTTGSTISGLEIEYTSLNPNIASIRWPESGGGAVIGHMRPFYPGQARLVARTYAYGVAKADTLTLTVTMPITGDVVSTLSATGTPVFLPSETRIRPYGIVFWYNLLDDSVDVTFDGPVTMVPPPASLCGIVDLIRSLFDPSSGTGCDVDPVVILPPPPEPKDLGFGFPFHGSMGELQVRQFSELGVYTYRSIRTGATGRIVVTDEFE